MTRSIITDLETGRRKYVSVAELTVLAMALDVPPLQLLYSDLPDGKAQPWPGATTRTVLAAQWFSGECTFLTFDGHPVEPLGQLNDYDSSVTTARTIVRDLENYRDAVTQLSQSGGRKDDELAHTILQLAGERLAQSLTIAVRRGENIDPDVYPAEFRVVIQAELKSLQDDRDDRARHVADQIRAEMDLPPRHRDETDGR